MTGVVSRFRWGLPVKVLTAFLLRNLFFCIFAPYKQFTHKMSTRKILFITQLIEPYVAASPLAERGRRIPQGIQELGNEIRTFVPKWGNINERRHQLHEVIRLSGLNVIINDTDHPLIIKVATLQPARMQVYFIDSEDYFQKRLMECDSEGKEYADNYERSIFYTRSVLETIKKLRWYPDVIYLQGWISATAPFYIKTVYKDDPAFANVKVVYGMSNFELKAPMPENYNDCLAFRNYTADMIGGMGMDFRDADDFARFAIKFSDGVIVEEESLKPELKAFAEAEGKPVLDYDGSEDAPRRYDEFLGTLFED